MREQLFIKGVEVPLSKSLNPSITKSIIDIKEPQKRKTEYTKTVTIPRSKEADRVLGMIFDINITNGLFNPTVKADILYLVDGAEVIRGFMQLKEIVTTNNHDIEYKAVLFGQFANFFKEIEGKQLNEITGLDTYDHILNQELQNKSSGNNGESYQIIEAGALVAAALGKGYIYALVDYGFSLDGERFFVDDIGCSIFVQEYWDRIWNDTPFTYEFLDSDFADHFKHLIVPASPSAFLLNSAEIAQRVFGANTPLLTSTGTINSNNLTKGSYTANDKIIFSNELFDDGANYSDITGEFTSPGNGVYNFAATFAVYATFKPTDGASPLTSVGKINFKAKIVFYDASLATETVIEEYETFIRYQGVAVGNRTTASVPVASDDNYFAIEYVLGIPISVSTGKAQPNLIQIAALNKSMNINDKIYIVWSANYATSFPDYFWDGLAYSGGEADITVEVGSFLNKVVNTPSLEGEIYKVEKSIPNVSQTDFIQNYVKEYNLFIQSDPNVTNHFLIAPRDTFYNNDVIDLRGKVAIDKGIVYKPVGALDSKKYLYKHKDDKDYLNEKYLGDWQETYGQREVTVINEFSDKVEKTEVNSSPTPLADQGNGNNRVLPTIVKVDELGEKVSTVSNWRTLYYGGLKDNAEVWYHKTSLDTSSIPQYQYPYAGHFDDPFNPTLDINFGLVREVYYYDFIDPIVVTDNNLYNKYHSKFIREITDKDSKIVEAYINMSSSDFKEWSFRNLYYFDNAYFRLNKIDGFNPTSNNLTKCEFLKLKEVSPFEPTLIGLDGAGDPFEPDMGGDNGGVIQEEYSPLLNIKQAVKSDGNNYNATTVRVQGENNLVSINSYDIDIQGDDNKIYSGVEGVKIVNSDSNTVGAGLQNVTIINSNGITVTESNVTYIDGVLQGSAGWLTKTASFTVDTTITGYYLDAQTGVNLLVNSTLGMDCIFKRVDTTTGTVTVSAGAFLIDGVTSVSLNHYESIRLRWNEEETQYSIVN